MTLDEALAEIDRLRRLNRELAERLAACSECLGRAAEKGKVTPEALEALARE